MSANSGWIILDRDGVLNALVVDPEQGTVNSPLHPSQVDLLPGAALAVRQLCEAGYRVSIATNQPAAAKGSTTMGNLEAVHARVLQLIASEGEGAVIQSSHICFHRAEDRCACRKPNTALLEDALRNVTLADRAQAWMVGDGVTDIEAGQRLKINTAYLGPQRCDHCKCLEERGLTPTRFFSSLKLFADWLCAQPRSPK